MANYGWSNDQFVYQNGAGKTTAVSMAEIQALSNDVQKFLLEYGVKQWFGSYLAKAANGTDGEYLATAQAAIDRLKAGQVQRQRGLPDNVLWMEVFFLLTNDKKKAEKYLADFLTYDEKQVETLKARKEVAAAIVAAKANILARRKAEALLKSNTPFTM